MPSHPTWTPARRRAEAAHRKLAPDAARLVSLPAGERKPVCSSSPSSGGGSWPPDHRGGGQAPERPEHLKSHRPDQSSPSESERETLTHGHRGHHLGGHLPTETSQHGPGGLCESPMAAVTNGCSWSGWQRQTLTLLLSQGREQSHWAEGWSRLGACGENPSTHTVLSIQGPGHLHALARGPFLQDISATPAPPTSL